VLFLALMMAHRERIGACREQLIEPVGLDLHRFDLHAHVFDIFTDSFVLNLELVESMSFVFVRRKNIAEVAPGGNVVLGKLMEKLVKLTDLVVNLRGVGGYYAILGRYLGLQEARVFIPYRWC
jgi:hypothetical protein